MSKYNINKSSHIGKNVIFGTNVIIGRKVKIGDNCVLENNIVIYDGTIIGGNCLIQDGAVLGKRPTMSCALTRKVATSLKPLEIESQTIVGTNAVVYSGTKIGSNCLIGDGANIREGCNIGCNTLIGRGVTINYSTTIGNNCKVLDLTHLTGEMIVEDDVFISTHVVSSNDNLMGRGKKIIHKGPTVKKGALIGGGAVLLPAVTVGEYSVIGAGAVVTKNIPPKKLALGVPAKVVMDTPERFLP